MRSKFDGFCPYCKRYYDAGVDITRGPKGWGHSACVRGLQAQPAAAAAAAAPKQKGYHLRWSPPFVAIRLVWQWPERERVHAILKNLPKRRWDMDAKAWMFPPQSIDAVVRAVKDIAPDLARDLLADPALAPAQAVMAEARAQVAASRAATVDVAVAARLPVPEGRALYPFQAAGVAAALKLEGVLLGDEMGLGKTAQSIVLANAMVEEKRKADPSAPFSVLVICPASLRVNWQRETEAWSTWEPKVAIVGAKEFPEADVVVANYEKVARHRKAIDARDWDLLVADEIHYLKSTKAQRTAAVMGKYPSQAPIKAGRRIFLTGTPVPNRPAELWTIVRALDPQGLGASWKRFVTRYAAAYETTVRTPQGTQTIWDTSGASNLAELQERLRQSCMIRRLKKDVLTELPPKTRQLLVIPAEGQGAAAVKNEQKVQAQGLAQIEATMAALELAKAAEDQSTYAAMAARLQEETRAIFTEISRARHRTALAKVDAVAEYCALQLEDGGVDKLIVFAWHVDVAQALMERLKPFNPVTMTGRESDTVRQRAKDSFQSDPTVRVIVCTIAAAGVGHTLHASSRVIFAEVDYAPYQVMQAEDRAHRIGQEHPVLVQHIVLDGSIDVPMVQALISKMDVQAAALDTVPEDVMIPEGDTSMLAQPEAEQATTRGETPDSLARVGAKLTEAQIAAIHAGLRLLAQTCDGARKLDLVGFNRIDAHIGKSLASTRNLTPKQAALGRRLLQKYRNTQLTAELCSIIWKDDQK